MKKNIERYKNLIIVIIGVLICSICVYIGYNLFINENALTIEEKTWIDDNVNAALNVNIVNDVNIFGNNATGVFYDFLEDFSSDYKLNINHVTYKMGDSTSSITLGVKTELEETDVVFFTDHYVLVSNTDDVIADYTDLDSLKIGSSKEDSFIDSIFDPKLTSYSDYESLLKAFEDGKINYILLPRYLYADYIIENDLTISYHINELEYYYVLETDDSTLSSVMKKYFKGIWSKDFYESFMENQFDLFVSSLQLTESQVDSLTRVDYVYGFTENSPYEVISSGNFGGITATLLSAFSEFSDAEFEFVKYNTYDELVNGIKNGNVDVFLNKYNITGDFSETENGFMEDYYIVANKTNFTVINSLNGLKGKTVYVEANTKIHSYLNTVNDIDVVTYKSESELFKLNNEDALIIIDSNAFDFYILSDLDNYNVRYTFNPSLLTSYAVASDEVLYILLDQFIKFADNEELIIQGINNHFKTISIGMILATLAKYILLFILICIFIIMVIIRKSKKIQLTRKIKKDDKLKYIDQLTSLKNRNYFNDSQESWNNNTIYPQSVILIDLNKIQKINDQFGYTEGDNQIKAFANALIKTQLDNSEIMRTDGNEFIIYLIGYSQKQIVNYIHKLNKEVEKLPYKEGAKFGYDMIVDDLKTVEDCLNDAANDMLEKNKND
ncbi:MAG: diguanylate cyclase [bacterium]